MTSSTDYKRMARLGLTKATVDSEALEVAFDPKRAYVKLKQFKELLEVLAGYRINSRAELVAFLEDNKKPPEGGDSETRAI